MYHDDLFDFKARFTAGARDAITRLHDSDRRIYERQQARAKERGHVCVYPGAMQLFLDIDSHEGLGRYYAAKAQNAYMRSIIAGETVKVSPSGKAGRFHVIVDLNVRVEPLERITLQALLGSDLSREILSYQEAKAGCERPTVFFEKAGAAPTTTAISTECPIQPVAPAVPSPDDDIDRPPSTTEGLRFPGPCLDTRTAGGYMGSGSYY